MTALRHITLPLALAAALAAAVPFFGRAGEPGPMPAIVDIRIEGDSPRIVQGTMLLRAGDPYTVEAGDADVRRIFESGRYINVELDTEPLRDGVRVIVRVTRKPAVAVVRFVGNRHMDDGELQTLSGVREGSPVDDLSIEQARRNIAAKYRLDGFAFAEVSVERRTTDDGVETSFTILEGPRVRVGDIRFTGHTVFSSRALRSRISTSTYFPIFKKGVYSREEIDRDALRLIAYYRNYGYLDARVTPEIQFSPGKRRAKAIFHVEEGGQYFVREIVLRGNTVFTDDELLKAMTLKPGEPFDMEGLRVDLESLEMLYGSKGYLDVEVDGPDQAFVGDDGLRLTYTFAEGEPFRIGTIDIVTLQAIGASQVGPRHAMVGDVYSMKTKDKVIRREIILFPGETFDRVRLEVSRRRLINTGFFEAVDIDIVPALEPGVRDVRVTVRERDTGSLRFGAGFGTNVGLVGDITFEQRNFDIARVPSSLRDLLEGTAFAGAGQTLTVNLSPGTEVSSASISFFEPHLFDSDFSYDVNAFVSDQQRFNYDERRYGFGTGVGYSWTQFLSSRLGVRAEEIRLRGIFTMTPPDVQRFEGQTSLRSLVFSTQYDRRDSPHNTTSGYILGHNVELATSALGSDEEYWKTMLTGSVFVPVYAPRFFPERKHVLSFTGRAGVGDGFGDSPSIPIFERFFAGGSGSVRGFRYRTIGPRWDIGRTPLGGQTMLTGTVEYTFPIIMVEEHLRGVLFYDTGTVTARRGDFDLDSLRHSVGFGLRLRLGEQLPMAFDFGFPLKYDDADDRQIFSFTVGRFF